MMISGREAARRLYLAHGWPRQHVRRVLAAGLAGPAERRGRALLYDEGLVRALQEREEVRFPVLDEIRPLALRLGLNRPWHVEQSWEEQAAVVGRHWYVPWLTRVWMGLKSCLGPDRHPVVATLSHCVVFGAEVVGFEKEPTDPASLALLSRCEPYLTWRLAPPGPWFDDFADRLLTFDRGPAWVLWGAPRASRWPTLDDTAIRLDEP